MQVTVRKDKEDIMSEVIVTLFGVRMDAADHIHFMEEFMEWWGCPDAAALREFLLEDPECRWLYRHALRAWAAQDEHKYDWGVAQVIDLVDAGGVPV